MKIKINTIVSNTGMSYADESLKELTECIEKFGVITPLIVTPFDDNKYEIVAGERRLEAAKKAGLEEIDVVVKYYER